MVSNLERAGNLSAIDLPRDAGRHFSVNRMLDRCRCQNNRRVTAQDAIADEGDLLHGRYLVLRRGKRAMEPWKCRESAHSGAFTAGQALQPGSTRASPLGAARDLTKLHGRS